MWDLNILFWLIMGTLCIGTAGYRLPDIIRKFKNYDRSQKQKNILLQYVVMQIMLAILGFSCLFISNNGVYNYGKRKIMTPEDLSQEIHKVEQQMEIPGYGAIVSVIDGRKTRFIVINSSFLNPEVSYVEKHQKIDGTWELRSTDYVDPTTEFMTGFEKRKQQTEMHRLRIETPQYQQSFDADDTEPNKDEF